MAQEPVSTDTSGATATDSPLVLSPLERGQQFLTEARYDEAIKEFKAAHELKPTVETHVGLATAMLRGRRVFQAGEMCDPAAFRAELLPHDLEAKETDCCWRWRSSVHPSTERHHELESAIYQLEQAAKLDPEDVAVHAKLTHARIALMQFDEEAACRQTMADVGYWTESDFGRITRMDFFELPSLTVFSGGMYSLDVEL